MKKIQLPKGLTHFFTDTIWSIAGLVFMNVIAQFLVYPLWNRSLGTEAYGNVVYCLAIMNIIAVTIGISANYARMRASVDGKTSNFPYLMILSIGSFVSLLLLLLLKAVNILSLSPRDFWLFCLLAIVTMWRFYSDVEFRLNINYVGYFIYYLIIGLGYLIGIGLFRVTGSWPLALLPGEVAGLIYVMIRGSIFQRDKNDKHIEWKPTIRLFLILVGSELASQAVFNGDRVLLRLMINGSAVTVFYIASLLGKTATLVTTPLNGVLIGYLARYNGILTKKMMHMVTLLCVGAVALGTLLCVIASYILLPIMYPSDFPAAKDLLIVANMAQVIYFVGNVMTASVLLRFTRSGNQLKVNVLYIVYFCVFCISLTYRFGVEGFCYGLLISNISRLLTCLFMAYWEIKRGGNQ